MDKNEKALEDTKAFLTDSLAKIDKENISTFEKNVKKLNLMNDDAFFNKYMDTFRKGMKK